LTDNVRLCDNSSHETRRVAHDHEIAPCVQELRGLHQRCVVSYGDQPLTRRWQQSLDVHRIVSELAIHPNEQAHLSTHRGFVSCASPTAGFSKAKALCALDLVLSQPGSLGFSKNKEPGKSQNAVIGRARAVLA
jgi:hypothetical protein